MLEGVLEDELGRYPKGAWLRNPPGSAHAPFSEEGCLLYVKTGHLGASPLGAPLPLRGAKAQQATCSGSA